MLLDARRRGAQCFGPSIQGAKPDGDSGERVDSRDTIGVGSR